MRRNLPVSGREYPVAEGATLMSTTDLKGRITYANAAFIAVSGFDERELVGKAHNIVRHPDMAPEAFSDLWATLQAGRSWTAVVKNRRKDGDHYWVRANVTPVRRRGQVVGYLSVRTRPTAAEVDQAERFHRALREGRCGQRGFHRGLVVRTGAMAWRSLLQRLPARWQIRAALASVAAVVTAAALAAGVPAPLLPGLLAAALGALLAACFWLERRLAQPLQQVLSYALSVAAGQPGTDVRVERVDEIGMILRAVSQAGLNLQALLDDVGGQVGAMQSASSEIAGGSQDLSARTEEAASSLQQTAASMQQLNAIVQRNADTAREAHRLAGSSSTVAGHGGEAMAQLVATMDRITASAGRIGDIVGLIDGMAFQTNILALNAAVEAARAGEQGRGFAVVAGEVRQLAQRSAEAARQVKQLVGESVAGVASGAALVQGLGQTIDDMVARARRVADLMGTITSATAEQACGIGQVSEAVGQLEQVTQHNATLVEQSTAAADGLRQQAHRLGQAVTAFRPA